MGMVKLTITPRGDASWEEDAACKGMDPNDFFVPDWDERTSDHEYYEQKFEYIRRSKAVCAGCPVVEACLAANMNAEYGVFGNTTPKERAAMRAAISKEQGRKHSGGSPKRDPETKALVRKLHEDGLSYREIQEKTGIQKGTISRMITEKEYHVIAPKGWDEKDSPYKPIVKMLEQGLTPAVIAKRTSYSTTTITRLRRALREQDRLPHRDYQATGQLKHRVTPYAAAVTDLPVDGLEIDTTAKHHKARNGDISDVRIYGEGHWSWAKYLGHTDDGTNMVMVEASANDMNNSKYRRRMSVHESRCVWPYGQKRKAATHGYNGRAKVVFDSEQARKMLESGMSYIAVGKELGVNPRTLHDRMRKYMKGLV